MLRTAKLVETSSQLFDSVTTVPLVEKCGGRSHTSSIEYGVKLRAKKEQILRKATEIEFKIDQG